MADKTLSQLIGGGGQIQLAPDLTFPSDKQTDENINRRITNIDGSSGLTPALSLTGKWNVGRLYFSLMTPEEITIQLTVDGIIIWNNTFTLTGSELALLGFAGAANNYAPDPLINCNSSFLLEIATATDTSVVLDYFARPIV